MTARILGWRSGKRVILGMRCMPHVVTHLLFLLQKKATRKFSAALVSYSSNSVHLIYFFKKIKQAIFCAHLVCQVY